jgi:hypothetical protein
MRFDRSIIVLFLACLCHADGIILGLPAVPANGNCIPFGCPGGYGVTSYQQVYSSTAFTGPFYIGGIDFFNTELVNGAVPAPGTYSFNFSYTNKSVGNLDLTNPLNNITSGSQAFFSGLLPNLAGGKLDFAGTPFLYDPANGNLLLTIAVSGGIDSIPNLFLDQAQAPSQTSRAWFGATHGGNDGGLVTQLDATVPEPASLTLLIGMVVLMGLKYLVRSQKTGLGSIPRSRD